MDKQKITYVFTLNDDKTAGNDDKVIKIHKLLDKDISSIDLIKSIPDSFNKAMKARGKTDDEIAQTDYMMAMVKGWC